MRPHTAPEQTQKAKLWAGVQANRLMHALCPHTKNTQKAVLLARKTMSTTQTLTALLILKCLKAMLWAKNKMAKTQPLTVLLNLKGLQAVPARVSNERCRGFEIHWAGEGTSATYVAVMCGRALCVKRSATGNVD